MMGKGKSMAGTYRSAVGLANKFAKRQAAKSVTKAVATAVGAVVSKAVQPKKKRAMKTLKKRVTKLEKEMKDDISRVVYIADLKDTLRLAVSAAGNGFRDFVSQATIELAIAQARFFDPATPQTLITGSLAAPTYSQSIGVSVSCVGYICNNFQVPCKVTYGVVRPKLATSVSPTTAWTNGLTDDGNPSNSSYLLTMRDSSQFTDSYRVTGKWKTVVLKPGQRISVKYTQKMFDYDPAFFDSNTATYQPRARSALLFYRVCGVFGHDTSVTTEQGILASGIDVHTVSRYNITYNSGGAAIKTIILSQGASSSFTNGGVVSVMPVADNLAYSVA